MSSPVKTAEKQSDGTPCAELKSTVVSASDLVSEDGPDGGTIQISERVIAAVVRRFTLEVDGVVGFANAGLVGGLAGMIHKRNFESSLVVDLEEDFVNISVTLVLRFGVRIPDVAQMVQDVIRNRVGDLTGKQVMRVNVLVQDLVADDVDADGTEIGLPAE